MNPLRRFIARHTPIPAFAFLTRFVVCNVAAPPPSRKFDITFALRRIGNGILAGFAFAAILAVAVLAAPDAQAQEEPCIFEDYASVFNAGEQQMQVSLQIDNCNTKGWGAVRGGLWPTVRTCHCNIKVHDFTSGTGGCAPPRETPEINCGFGIGGGNTFCRYFFGATLQYLPQRTEQNKDSCFASHCQKGQEPSGVNMNGETECACPAGEGVLDDGNCGACPAGKGIRDNGNCGNCPAGEGILANGKCGNCADDQFINPASVCTDSPLIGCQEDTGAGAACFEDACDNAGWDSAAETFWCDINSHNAANGAEKGRCLAPTTNASKTYPHCSEIFGPYSQDLVRDNNYFPQKPADGSKPHYVYNCDPDGTSGMIPATINTIGATECACPAGQGVRDNGNCGACPGGEAIDANGNCNACSSGEEVVGGFCVPTAIKVGAQNCLAASRKFSAADGGSCAVAVTLSGGTLYGKCRLSGPGSPQCADVFGAGLDFPSVSIDGPFIYDCDPTGSKGLIPATTNTIGATECSCPAGMREYDGMCVEADRCFFEDLAAEFLAANHAQVSLQIDNCNAKGWGAKRNPDFDSLGHLSPSFRTCYCDIKAKDVSRNAACGGADAFCIFGFNTRGNTQCPFYFGDTLQHLPQKTEENKDSCFVANCPGGQEPSGFNMNGETECACPAGKELEGGVCTCTSGASLPDGSCVVTCPAGQFLRDGECACPAGQIIQEGVCVACPLEQAAFHGRCIDGNTHTPESNRFREDMDIWAYTFRFGANPEPVRAKMFEVMRIAVDVRFNGDPNYYDLVADRDKGGAQGPLYIQQYYRDIIGFANMANLHLDDVEFDDENLYELSRILSYTPTFPDAADECWSAGWGFSADGPGSCGVPLTLSGGAASEQCYLYKESEDDSPLCAEVFGATVNYFPAPVVSLATTLRFVYNCDPEGSNGLIPATVNTVGATECACPIGASVMDGVCHCPDGEGVLADGMTCGMCPGDLVVRDRVCAPTTEHLCATSKSWTYNASDDSCGIRVTLSGGAVSNKCHMTGSLSPQCADVFGSLEGIPQYDDNSAAGIGSPFIYNCDPGETPASGLLPATINTIGATACKCPLGEEFNDGACAPIECAEGQALLTLKDAPGGGYSVCHDEDHVAVAKDCGDKGWDVEAFTFKSPNPLVCHVSFVRYFADGTRTEDTQCVINPEAPYIAVNICRDIFGDPPQFPTATGNEEEDEKNYASHCNREGKIPGGIPETINTVGAKACGCDGDFGYVGDWPNCAGPDYEVVYSYFPPSLSVNVGGFAITPFPPAGSSITLGLPLIDGVLRATLAAKRRIRLHLTTDSVSVAASGDEFCDGAGFSNHGTGEGASSNCDLAVHSDINIELYLSPTVATAPPPRRVRVGGVAGLAVPADESGGQAGGTVAVAGDLSAGGWTDAGTTVTFTATPAEGWYVRDWEGEGGICPAGNRDTTGDAGEKTCALAADNDLLVTARFAEPGSGITVVFSYAPATLALAPNALAIADASGEILATLSGDRAVALDVEENSTVRLSLLSAPAGYGVASVSFEECRARFTGFHGGLPEPERGPERGPSAHGGPCMAEVDSDSLDIALTFAPLADCEENNLSLIESSPETRADAGRRYNRLLCGACPEAIPPALPTHRLVGDYCVPLSGDFGTLSDKALCGIFGGNMDESPDVCSGMDKNDTFCIMDAEEADGVLAFPCRGLFKHLRSCNLTHNRPALNPFFCGAKCGVQKAVGSECR